MPHTNHDIGIAKQIGTYSDAVEAKPNLRWLMTSGTPGLSEAGKLPGGHHGPGRARLGASRPHAGTGRYDGRRRGQGHPVSHASRRHPGLREGAEPFPGRTRGPHFMLVVVSQLVRPEFLVEVEIVAARA